MTQDADMELEDEEAEESGPRGLRNKLKDAERRAREAEERANTNEAAARRVAFLDAGIPDNPQTRYFQSTYSGDLNGEAIKSAAQAHGFMAAQEAETNAEIDQIDSMSQTSQGAESPEQAASDEALDRELREAAEAAYKAGEPTGPALEAVLRRFNRPVASDFQ